MPARTENGLVCATFACIFPPLILRGRTGGGAAIFVGGDDDDDKHLPSVFLYLPSLWERLRATKRA